jgi:phosphate-selective porin
MGNQKPQIILLVVVLLSVNVLAQTDNVSKVPKFSVQLGSYYTYDATEAKVPSSTFSIGFARFIAKGNVMDKISYQIMTDLGGLSDAAAGLTTRRSILMQAWVSYDMNEYAKFRIGQYKYPFGIEGYSSITTWKFASPSYATLNISKKLGTEGRMFRDIGAQVSGKVSANKDISFFYKAMVMNGNGANMYDNNNEKDIVANLGINLPYSITVAGSYFVGKTYDANLDGINESAFSANVALKQERFTLQAEYISETMDFINSSVKPSGYYLYGTYRVLPKLEVGARYDAYDRDSEVDNNSQDRITLQTGYYFSKLNRIMINYEIRNDDTDANLGNYLALQFQIVL